MTMPYYASAEQIMRDRSELAKKGISRGRSVIIQKFAHGIIFVAENSSKTLHKVSEIYDRLGFAAVGKYNEFEILRRYGIQKADQHGFEYSREDVSGRSLANIFALYLGTVFTEQPKPYEVELCVAEISSRYRGSDSQLYKITYDGSIVDEDHYVVMGGASESIVETLHNEYAQDASLETAFHLAYRALLAQSRSMMTGTSNTSDTKLLTEELEVAILDSSISGRSFRRLSAHELIQKI